MYDLRGRSCYGCCSSDHRDTLVQDHLDQDMASQVKLCCLLNFYVGCEACGLKVCKLCHGLDWINHRGPNVLEGCQAEYHYTCPSTKKVCHRAANTWQLVICDKPGTYEERNN